MRILLIAVIGLAFVGTLVLPQTRSQDDVRIQEVGGFMRAKLDNAQKVLDGLARADFERITKHAQELTLVNLESQWKTLQTPDYDRLSSDFRRATQNLSKAGREKNLDAATLAYVEMTLKCVQCHNYIRDAGPQK